MQMSGEQKIAAPRQRVWEALNDPEILRQAIPGCQSLERTADNQFAAIAEVKIGPIGARFKGNVALSDIDASNGYTISGSGNGGIAGNAKGGAKISLSDAPGGGTLLSYTVDAEVGGRMAQLGGPIIDATAKNLAAKFFAGFDAALSGGVTQRTAGAQTPTTSATAAPMIPEPANAGRAGLWGWIAALVGTLLAGYYLGLQGEDAGLIAIVGALLIIVATAGFEAGRRGGRR